MRVSLPQSIEPFARVFQDAGVSTYAVGGTVRNLLLGLPPSDLDLCSALLPGEVKALFAAHGARIVEKAPELGTVELHLEGFSAEHTTFRRESYAPGGAHRPSQACFTRALAEDARRRDFTVNALYAALGTGEVTDLTGGLADLSAGVLRVTSPDPAAIMQSDALRVLRLVRFACELGFTVDEASLAAAAAYAPGLADIAAERRRDELFRILVCDARYPGLARVELRGVYRGLTLLDTLGAWPYLIPALTEGRDTPQRVDVHRYRVMAHNFHVCAATPPALPLRLGGLLHDVGKPACLARDGNFLRHAELGEEIAREALTLLRCPKALTQRVCELVRFHMYDVQGTAKEATLRRRFAGWGRALTRALIVVREADIIGCGCFAESKLTRWRALYARMEEEGAPFCEGELRITGERIMTETGLPPSPAVGEIKRALLLHCAVRPKDNEETRLARLAEQLARRKTQRGRGPGQA